MGQQRTSSPCLLLSMSSPSSSLTPLGSAGFEPAQPMVYSALTAQVLLLLWGRACPIRRVPHLTLNFLSGWGVTTGANNEKRSTPIR